MSRGELRVDDDRRLHADVMFRFVSTLVVATFMVALTAYVLSFAVLGTGRPGPTHSAATQTMHARL